MPIFLRYITVIYIFFPAIVLLDVGLSEVDYRALFLAVFASSAGWTLLFRNKKAKLVFVISWLPIIVLFLAFPPAGAGVEALWGLVAIAILLYAYVFLHPGVDVYLKK